MHRENITPLLPTKHSTCKAGTSAGKAIPTLGPHPSISLRTEMCTHLNNKLVCTQIHYEHLEIRVRQLQTEDFAMSYNRVKSAVTRWSLWTKKRPSYWKLPQYAHAVWLRLKKKRCIVYIFYKHNSWLTSSIGSSSSCGKQGASTPMRNGVGEQLTSSMLAGSTGMKVCCQVNG